MTLPFTRGEFLDVFGVYNTHLWPAAAVLWLTTVAVVIVFAVAARPPRRLMTALLAFHWAWSGIVYHGLLFTTINPAAWLFAVLFVAQAVMFAWWGAALEFSRGRSIGHTISWTLIVYALLYPGLAWAGGLVYPRLPTFGVPCPTTIFTAGVLLAAEPPLPAAMTAIPIAWTVIGGSAALFLGIHADLILPVAGCCLVASLVHKRQLRMVRS
jgi:hypothetical protein